MCNTFILSKRVVVRTSQGLTLGSVITGPPHYGPCTNKGFPVKKYGRPYPWFYGPLLATATGYLRTIWHVHNY